MKKFFLGLIVILVVGFWWYQRGQNDVEMATTPTPSTQPTTTKKPATHTVQAGEGLWIIAEKELGSGFKWTEIAAANNLTKPYILRVGQELTIPGKEIEVAAPAENTFTLAQVAEHASKESCWL